MVGRCGQGNRPLAEELLEAPKDLILTAFELELSEGNVIADMVDETARTFLAGLYRAEQTIAQRVIRIVNGKLAIARCRVMAPISSRPFTSLIPASSDTPFRSIRFSHRLIRNAR